ncbi:hypothetical protein KIW84_051396 [Lathyrus oleraceus]|uniref:Uncharacterized protein n=1 Tax=Pisum sativum TaxID=3888 RepID=A0A9D5AAL8_PEA|nr:hypothetical protein KIW84_051396 [Pisum sativum]
MGVDEAIKELNALDFEVANVGGLDVEVMASKRSLASNEVWHSSFLKESMSLLEKHFSLEEIKIVIWHGDGDKSLSPDGFNLNFYRACWDIMMDDLLKVVEAFYHVDRVPKVLPLRL